MTISTLNSSLADTFHRGIKLAIDSGEASSVEEAERIFRGYRVSFRVGAEIVDSATLQAALLTGVNAASRSFLGGVRVAGPGRHATLRIPWRGCTTLGDATRDLGAQWSHRSAAGDPVILLGSATPPLASRVTLQASFEGWTAQVAPAGTRPRLAEHTEFTPAGVLAGALAVSEAFQVVRGGNARAGRRAVGLSLWRPDLRDWTVPQAQGPLLEHLPADLWLVGLGHLGQSYLWTLGLLPYAHPVEVQLVLQDFDFLATSNLSTSPLTFPALLGQRKTRAMAAWCEARGFRTALVERPFAAGFQVLPEEPKLCLFGVDNPAARRDLEEVGFRRVVEAGLGTGTTEFLAFQVHSFPGPRRARQKWPAATMPNSTSASLLRLPAYRALEGSGEMDECGLERLAGRAVGVPFVGLATATLVVAEVLRELHGGTRFGLIDGTLASAGSVQAISVGEGGEAWYPRHTAAAL
jgi:hypothetical protein